MPKPSEIASKYADIIADECVLRIEEQDAVAKFIQSAILEACKPLVEAVRFCLDRDAKSGSAATEG